MKKAQELARIFKVLSVDTRVRILQMLKDHPLCVGALSAGLDITQGAVSQHLRVLRDADLVVAEKRGYYVHYRLNEQTFDKWRKAVETFLTYEPAETCFCVPRIRKGKGGKSCVMKNANAKGRKN